MLKRNSLTSNVHSNTTALTANFSIVKGENRLAVYCIDDFGKVWNVLAKRPLLPCIPYRRGLFWLNSPDIYGVLCMKTFYNVVNSIICCAKEARASIVLNIEWVQFVLKNCAKLHSVRGLLIKDSASTFTSDVMFKKYKRQPFFHATRFVGKIL